MAYKIIEVPEEFEEMASKTYWTTGYGEFGDLDEKHIYYKITDFMYYLMDNIWRVELEEHRENEDKDESVRTFITLPIEQFKAKYFMREQ